MKHTYSLRTAKLEAYANWVYMTRPNRVECLNEFGIKADIAWYAAANTNNCVCISYACSIKY